MERELISSEMLLEALKNESIIKADSSIVEGYVSAIEIYDQLVQSGIVEKRGSNLRPAGEHRICNLSFNTPK